MDDEADSSAAERAFEALRAEVAGLRAGIELVSRQGQEAKGVDYSLTLGSMAKSLQALEERLAELEGKPALTMTPAVYREQIAEAGRIAAEMAGRALAEGAAAQSTATQELRGVAAQARAAREQRAWLATAAVLGVMGGLVLWFLLVGLLPRSMGTWLTALPLAGGDRWAAGQALLRAGDPAEFGRLVQLSQACGDRPVARCTAAIAVRAGAEPGRVPLARSSGGRASPRD